MAPSLESGNTSIHDRLSDEFNPSARNRPVIRRKRSKPKHTPVSVMSLVGLKNLFFKQTIIPVPVRSSENGTKSASSHVGYWNHGSQEPLLREANISSGPLISQSAPPADIESQSIDSKTEKSRARRGFRVDARIISDATIGLSDGLTVPFALTAGLSALGNTKVVLYGGFAELIAGAISVCRLYTPLAVSFACEIHCQSKS